MSDYDEVMQMSYEEVSERFDEVRVKIDDLVAEQFSLHCALARMEGECLPDNMHMTEFMIICAWQAFNERGQRGGDVRLMLRDGAMPAYTARGLLASAESYVERKSMCQCDCETGEEDGA